MDRSIDLYKVVKAHYKYKPYTITIRKIHDTYRVSLLYSPHSEIVVFFEEAIIHHFLELEGKKRELWRDYINKKLDVVVFEVMEVSEVF